MKPQLIGTCIVVLDKNKKQVLLGKRLNSFKSGFYGLPGGRLELEEQILKGGQRELFEETGLETPSLQYLGVIKEFQDTYNFVHFALICAIGSDKPRAIEPEKCAGWEWFSLDQLPEKILPGHKAAIDIYLNPHLHPLRDI